MRKTTPALALAAALLAAPALHAQQPAPGGTQGGAGQGSGAAPMTPGTPGTGTGTTGGTMGTGTPTPAPSAQGADERRPPTTTTPEAGANSFTEGQARSRIEDAGYTDVQSLRRDDQGVWRGQAMRNGTRTEVGLDFRGNVVTGNAPAAPR